MINTISNSTITADGVYYTSGSVISSGTISGNVTNIALSSLKNKTFLTDTLLFKEFVDSNDMVSNPSNIWIYEEDNFDFSSMYWDVFYFNWMQCISNK